MYESLLLLALLLVTGFAVLPLVGPPQVTTYATDQLYVLPLASRAFLFFLYVVILGAYCIGFWTNGRRTLPMKTWGIALQSAQDQPVQIRDAIKRYLAAWIGPAIGLSLYAVAGAWALPAGLINYYWAWIDPDRRFLHDRLAGTRLVKA